jgi:crotonobetainyl-CoA:carnitine CoA-transferase CaiB-like acyl-CoA transferase
MNRVLEVGGYAAGYAGRLFQLSGCEVVRAEVGPAQPAWVSEAAMDLFLHRGKRRIATSDTGLLAELAARADVVVVEARSAAEVDALGLHKWSTPIRVAVTPFGLTGPKRNWQATPSTLLAMGGYTRIMGDAGRPPLSLPGHYVEFQSGALAYTAARANARASQPGEVDVSMLESVMAMSQFTTVRWHCAGEVRERHGSDYWYLVPANLFRCHDGWVYVQVTPNFWDAFVTFLDRPELLLDERFQHNNARMQNREALLTLVADALLPLTTAEAEARAEESRVPLGVVMSLGAVLSDPHLEALALWQDVDRGAGPPIRSPGLPWRVAGEKPPSASLQEVESTHG